EIAELATAVRERPQAREAQRVLAQDVTTLVHGAAATERVERASRALFGRGDLRDLDPETLGHAVAELPRGTAVVGESNVVDLLVATGLANGRSAARRTVAEGGAYLNNVKVTDEDHVLAPEHLLAGRWVLLRRGRRNLAVAQVSDTRATACAHRPHGARPTDPRPTVGRRRRSRAGWRTDTKPVAERGEARRVNDLSGSVSASDRPPETADEG